MKIETSTSNLLIPALNNAKTASFEASANPGQAPRWDQNNESRTSSLNTQGHHHSIQCPYGRIWLLISFSSIRLAVRALLKTRSADAKTTTKIVHFFKHLNWRGPRSGIILSAIFTLHHDFTSSILLMCVIWKTIPRFRAAGSQVPFCGPGRVGASTTYKPKKPYGLDCFITSTRCISAVSAISCDSVRHFSSSMHWLTKSFDFASHTCCFFHDFAANEFGRALCSVVQS